MAFISKFSIEHKGTHWLLRDNLCYRGKHEVIVARQGFRTDLRSLPWLAGWLIPAKYYQSAAAVLHSYCYIRLPLVIVNRVDEPRKNLTDLRPITRKESDGLLRRALIEAGVARWRAALVYGLCRVLGSFYWNKARQVRGL
jgi:hypothetical protein